MLLDSKDKKLLKASIIGDVKKVKKLLIEGANVNVQNKFGRTPLHLVASYDYFEIAKVLIVNGANVNAQDKNGWTPLHEAAFWGCMNVVKLLIENGANVNAKNKFGNTPLHLASIRGNIEIVRLLLEHGADQDIINNGGNTAVDLARNKGYFGIVKLIEEFKSIKILNIEVPKLFVDEWGKILVKVKGKGKVSINLEGDVEWKDPGINEISGESTIEIPVKPKVSGEVPVKVIIDSPYGKRSSTIFLKIEKKEVKPIQPVTSIIVQKAVPEIGDVIPLRNIPLKNLVSDYGCSGSKLFKVNLSSTTVPKEFEGVWNCCLLGCGGWGCAYLATRGNEKIVIKVPRGFESVIEGGIEAPTSHEALLKKIRSETEIMSSLNHPNIIKFLGASSRIPLVIYEYADYGSLYWQIIKGWRSSLRDAVLVGIQLGDALRYIHSRGLIHGDIKPSNVFIKNGVAKLGDFSSTVKLLSSVSISKLPYTVGFRAPEQVFLELKRKARELGVENRIDIYQLGNLLLYILTGESIDGEDADDEKLVMEKLSMVPNEELRSVLEEALRLEPDKRPSAEEFTKKLYNIWKKIAQ
jgi:serine/threonine protein kinase